MADELVPCINATKYEVDNGKHLTRNEDRHCQPCKNILDRFEQRRQQGVALAQAEAASEEEPDYVNWNTGECARCGGAGILGVRNDAHPSMYGMDCPDCQDDREDDEE